MMKTKMILALGLTLVTSMLSAQKTTKERLDSMFNALSTGNKSMGSICVSRDGKAIYCRAIGYCAIDGHTRLAATESTKYRIASITKMFTAAIIFRLIQDGKIDYSSKLSDYFPKLPGAKSITIEMLMSHRSGLHNIFDDADFTSWKTIPRTKDEIVKMIGKFPLDFKPNSKAAYSNSNYILLGYIIERECKKPYEDVVKNWVISKLGLKNTYYGDKADPARNESYSYVYTGQWDRQPEADMGLLGAAGGLVSTPTDLNKFIEAVYNNKFFKARQLKRMQEIRDGYGMGTYQFTFGEHVGYGHPGSIDGFSSVLEYFPDDKIAISYCSNGTVTPVKDIVNGVLSIVFSDDQ
jgi:D-alanyl-D-alanine carboxypeptidase